MRIGILFLSLLTTAPLFGGQIVSNGGAVVHCNGVEQGERVDSTELLDFFEGKMRGWTYELGGANSVDDKVEVMLERLEVLDPALADKLNGWWQTFDDESTEVGNLPRVNDVGEVEKILPRGCGIHTAAGQRIPTTVLDPRYLFLSWWYKKLVDDNQRAGLKMHELFYRHAIEKGHRESIATRFFVSLLATPLIDDGKISQDLYQQLLFQHRLDAIHFGRFRLYPDKLFDTVAEAREFCQSLSKRTYLSSINSNGTLSGGRVIEHLSSWQESEIGQFLIRQGESTIVSMAGFQIFYGHDVSNHGNVGSPGYAICYTLPE